jgi:hypothetical protein
MSRRNFRAVMHARPSNLEDQIHMLTRICRNVDVTMLQMLNTQERSLEEWQDVVNTTDPRLEITGVFKPEGSWDSIIEISQKTLPN